MRTFEYTRASDVAEAIRIAATSPVAGQGATVRFVAGGTTLLDLMKLDVETPARVVDINRLPLAAVDVLPDGRTRIGALVRNADLAHHPKIARDYPVLAEALLAGASAQLRNMATTGGNLLQRTRCAYFRNDALACNKRVPGSGCDAKDGDNRTLAILGTSDACIATNPSDMNVALAALDAVVAIEGPGGSRDVPFDGFFLAPGATPERETVLEPGDLVTAIVLPAPIAGARQTYLKLRDRLSYEFALASAAVIVRVDGERIAEARVGLGGVATTPWRARAAETILVGARADDAAFRRAADAALADAKPQTHNAFKIELSKRCIVRALTLATRATA